MPSHIRSLAALLILTSSALAGPLNPPAGPITSTQKPLAEVEPRIAINATNTPGDADSVFKISQPGSYYLAGNITGVSSKHGIEITSSGVTIDLNGFDLVGVPGSFHGIATTVSSLTSIEVRNGAVRSWAAFGVNFASFSASAVTLRDIRSIANGQVGISVPDRSVISNCFALSNGNNGINAGDECLVTNCAAHFNGLDGVDVSGGCTIVACVSTNNTLDGFEIDPGCSISQCAASSNGANGISAGSGSTIIGCSLTLNLGDGISATNGSTITNNACRQNGLDGIRAATTCIILANTCAGNGLDAATGAGIHVTSGDNRIEGNHCAGQDRGIDIDAAGNLIIRNTCANNTANWDIAANNVFGPIINRTAPASPAVTGDAAASSLGSTDPNANYTY